jgi:hypothetical protein
MPDALLKPCSYPGGCPKLVAEGRCDEHRDRRRDRYRGTAHERGYTFGWRKFCAWLYRRLIQLDILPVCGAILPGGPVTTDSRCKSAGLLTGAEGRLHWDHAPALTAEERKNPRAVCDLARVQLLCETCHNAKTGREQRRTQWVP